MLIVMVVMMIYDGYMLIVMMVMMIRLYADSDAGDMVMVPWRYDGGGDMAIWWW